MRFTVLLCTSLLAGCVGHILPYTPKVRTYNPGDYSGEARPLTPGSLFVDGQGWFSDPRAGRLGDIITVRIDEGDTATSQATTNLSRNTKMDAGLPALLNLTGALAKALPGLDPTKLLSFATNGQHAGQGSTSRSGKVAATLPVRIKRVLPNGDFYVEGSKVLLVNSEEHHLYLSGVVRPVDLLVDNSVASSRVAEAQVEITGRGVVSEKQNPGWAARVLDYVWPF